MAEADGDKPDQQQGASGLPETPLAGEGPSAEAARSDAGDQGWGQPPAGDRGWGQPPATGQGRSQQQATGIGAWGGTAPGSQASGPGWGTGGYPPPGAYPPPAGYPPLGASPLPGGPPPPRRHRSGLVVGLAIAVAALLVVAIGLGVMVLTGRSKPATASRASHRKQASVTPASSPPSTSPAATHKLALPASADGYHRMTGSTARTLVAAARAHIVASAHASGGAASVRSIKRVLIGLYSSSHDPASRLVFFGFGPDVIHSQNQTPAMMASSFLLGAKVKHSKRYPPGPDGGVLYCGARSAPSETSYCIWADSSTAGALIDANVTPDQLAQVALAFRARAEY